MTIKMAVLARILRTSLQGYRGPLQVDGYQGYEQTEAKLAGCWAQCQAQVRGR